MDDGMVLLERYAGHLASPGKKEGAQLAPLLCHWLLALRKSDDCMRHTRKSEAPFPSHVLLHLRMTRARALRAPLLSELVATFFTRPRLQPAGAAPAREA